MRPLVLLVILSLAFAPAPLQRRSRQKPCPFPASCTMVFCSIPYAATFSPDGHYTASGNGVRWVGSWSLGGTARGRTLVIHETIEGVNSWITFVVPLDGSMRRGVENYEGRFLLE